MAKLPAREARLPAAAVDYTTAAVAAYARDVVEAVEDLDGDVVADVMEALCAQRIAPPVAPSALAAVLKGMYTNAKLTALFKAHAPLIPRMLKTLNGRAYRLIPPSILAEAVRREEHMSMTAQGWGVAEPPAHATAYRLLVSAGLPPELLPPYTSLPAGARARIAAAWTAACAQHGWEAVQPPKDLRTGTPKH